MLLDTHRKTPPLTKIYEGNGQTGRIVRTATYFKDRPLAMEHQLDPILEVLAHETPVGVSGGFMEGVWERVGDINARRERTLRSALFAGLFAVGLGAGAITVQAPAYAKEPTYPLISDVRLSPAALLHVAP